jgi:hypothetical protein
LVWVKNTVSITIGDDGPGMIVATIEPVSPPDDHSPATLLDTARLHIKARRNRGSVCDPMFFSESGWDTILAVYVTEAEGRSVDVERLAGLLGKSVPITDRWVTALLRADVLEIEYGNPRAEASKTYRLTAETHRKLEQFLARDHRL